MKILISDALSEETADFFRKEGFEVADKPGLSEDDLLSEIQDVDGLVVRSRTRVTPEVVAAARSLKVVGRAGAGVDNIDLQAATGRGIVVMNTPGGNSTSAAEHAIALLLALARKIPFAHQSLQEGRWDKSSFTGQELYGKTLGLLGLGKIGGRVASRGLQFGLRVIVCDPFVSEEYAQDLGVELVSRDAVLEDSDFLSLHLPLTDETRHVINAQSIARMRPGALIVNTARGRLVREADLIDALEAGQLGGAALDVFEKEPEISERLRRAPGVILTPHIAGSTREAQRKVGLEIARQMSAYLKDDIIANAVNFPALSLQHRAELMPYVRLGERLGALIGQICSMRLSEVGIRYYGELAGMEHAVLTNYILKSILRPMLSHSINEISARQIAQQRGIQVIETVSSRARSYSNLISIQLRSRDETEWIEGAILRKGHLRLVSIDGIAVETELSRRVLFIRNDDTPGVIGQVGTILGEAGINIAAFVLGRGPDHPHAIGVVNIDGEVPADVLARISAIEAVRFAAWIDLVPHAGS